jgi:hypothetical protein
MKKQINILVVLLFLTSCGTAGDLGKVLRNEKMSSTDEFLVKKNEPLSQPPDYQKLPTPDSLKKSPEKNNNDELSLKRIMNQNSSSIPKTNNKSVEQSILNEIRK